VEITGVTAQMASAKLVSGSEEVLAAGDLLVRPMAARAADETMNAETDDAPAREKKKANDSDW
jgi:hypothetical protein